MSSRVPFGWQKRPEPMTILRMRPLSRASVVAGYSAAIVAAQAIAVYADTIVGVVCDCLLVLAMLTQFALSVAGETDEGDWVEPDVVSRSLPALALLPLLGILSVTMPSRHIAELYWYALVGVPLCVALLLAARTLDLSPRDLGFTRPANSRQLLIAASGIPLAVAAYLLVRPRSPVAHANVQTIVAGIVILTIFSGFAEEVLFRGLIQPRLRALFGDTGIVLTALLFAGMYLGAGYPSGPASYVLFAGAIGLLFGWCVARTGSIWGVGVAHSILNVGAILILPLVWK